MSEFQNQKRSDAFILTLLLAIVFMLAARVPMDADLGWHLAAGRESVSSGRPMLTDSFSYTRAGSPWINHSWLSQLVLYGLYLAGGYLGLGVWVALLATISMGLTYLQMKGPAILRAFLAVFASTVTAVVWSPRPQMASLVLFALLGWILYRYKWKGIDQLWLLPGLFLLWSNLHGGWALGYIFIGVMLAGEILNRLLGNTSIEVLPWQRVLRLALWGVGTVPCLVINPNGLDILKIPFQTVEVQALQQLIQEWASPDFHDLIQQPFLWLLMGTLAVMALSGRRADLTDLATVVVFGSLGLTARRNFGPFALAVAPVLSRYLWAAYQTWRNPAREGAGGWGPGSGGELTARFRPRWQQVVNLILVGVFILAALVKLWYVTQPMMVKQAMAQMEPAAALDYLKKQSASGRIFNEYNWGGYLVWELPACKIFVDGRTDLFGDAVIGEWIRILQAEPAWQAKLDGYRVDWVLIDPGRPLVRELAGGGWIEVFRDDHSVLWKRGSSLAQAIDQAFGELEFRSP